MSEGGTFDSQPRATDAMVEGPEPEGILAQLDGDDIVEAFIGALLAGLVALLIARALPARRR